MNPIYLRCGHLGRTGKGCINELCTLFYKFSVNLNSSKIKIKKTLDLSPTPVFFFFAELILAYEQRDTQRGYLTAERSHGC
jgi:hypothetical protein